jgi:2-methylisocitrate lyase-like PEP mutase family enzyme
VKSRNARLRELLAGEHELLLPGVHDALSARVAEAAGWPALYLGSYAISASAFGLPDTGFLGLTDVLERARAILGATDHAPLVVDAEGGFANAATVWRTVQALEDIGVSGFHIEDHVFGKHLPVDGHVLPLEEMLRLLEAALDARTDPDLVVIARTDTGWLPGTGGVEEAVRRAVAFHEAGADLVFLAVVDDAELRRHPELRSLPLCTVDASPLQDPRRVTGRPGFLAADPELDVRARLLYYHLLHATYSGTRRMLDALAQGSTPEGLEELGIVDEDEFEGLLGIDRVLEGYDRYLR